MLAVLPASVLADATSGGLDVGTMLVSYGVAAPFAGLCLWQMRSREAELVKVRAENSALQAAALEREKDSTLRIATLLADAGRLYRQGNEVLAQHPSADHEEMQALNASVQALLRRFGEDAR